MDVAIKSAHHDCERNIYKDWFGQRCVEGIVKCGQKQSIVSKCDTQIPKLCVVQSVDSQLLS